MKTFLLSLLFSCFAFIAIAQPPITGTFTVCVGSTTALSDASSGGTWSSSNTVVGTIDPSTGVAIGLSSGVTTITYNLGALGFVTQDVTVNPLPATIAGPAKMCLGDVTTLTDATAGGTWSSSSPSVASVGSGTGVTTALSPGLTTISYTLPTGCVTSYVLIVNPAAGPITGPNTVGIGGNITLSSPPSGGAWTSSNAGLATIGSASGIVTGISSGIVLISYTLPTGCFATYSVTVTPLVPTIVISYSSPAGGSAPMVCVGGTMTVSATPSGGVWTSSSNAVATVGSTSGIVTGVSTGLVVMTYTLSPGVYGTVNITVNPNPLISGPNNVCVGSTIALTGSPTGGVWSSGSPTIATVVSGTGVVTGVSPGVAIITYMLSTGCYDVYSVTVNPNPGPIIGVPGTIGISVCVGNSLTLTNAVTGGIWTSGNITVATIGSASGTLTGVTPGVTLITYTLPSGCFVVAPVTVNPSPSAISGPNTVCTGSSINLTSSGGGIWSSGSPGVAVVGSASGTVTGVSAGTAVITYMLPSGCFVTTTITVNQTPTIGASTGTQVCVGNSIILASSPTGGIWTSGNILIATVGSSSGVITGVGAGTVMITYTLSTGCMATIQITVNPMPTAISGPSTVCVGSTINLTSSPSGGTWTSGAPGTATVSGTGVVTGISPGVATITYSLVTGCFVTMDVTVNPVPVISVGATGVPGASVCTGNTTTLTASPTGGMWTSSNNAVATVGSSTGVVTGVSPGIVLITYTLSTGCFAVVPVTVNLSPTAISGPSTVCVGSTVSLTSSPSGGIWTSGSPGTATVSGTGIVTGISPGVATITYSLASGCFVTMDVTVNPVPVVTTGSTGVPGASICTGNTIILTGSPTGGIWTSSNIAVATVGSSSGIVTGISPGVVLITYTLSTGCFTVTPVTVNLSPTAIAGPSTVCVGSTVSLTSSPSGGTWSSGSPGTATVSGTGVVTGISPGVATITYSLASGCFVTMDVTVNPVPVITSGTTGVPGITVCAGSTITLTGSPTGGTWSSSNVAVATVGSLTGIVTGVTAGVAFITYTLPTGCFSVVPVIVNPMPGAITGPSSVCVGNTIVLTGTPSGGTWISGSPGIGTITGTGVVTGISPGVTTITYTLPGGCFTTTDVTVNPQPTIITGTTGLPVSSLCVGDLVTLTSNPTGGIWTSSNSSIATVGSATGTVTAIAPGVVMITYTLPTGCFTTITITVNPTPVITGLNTVCTGSTINLTGSPTGGVWTSGSPGVAVVGSSSGIVSGVTAGTAVITYMLPTGCYATTVITVNQTPTIGISTGLSICAGSTFPMPGSPGGGVWTSTNTSVATIGSLSGILTGVAPGVTTIIYTLPTGCSASMVVTVNPMPTVITGPTAVCVGGTIGLGSTPTGGIWTSGNPSIATIGSLSGVVTGISPGIVNITYMLPGGCFVTTTVTVNANPVIITGTGGVPGASVCVGNSVALTATPPVGVWSSGNTTIATVGSASGIVTGVSPGVVVITFTLSTGCFATTTVTVYAMPVITGPLVVCTGSTTNLTGTPSGGIWTSGSPGIAAVGSASGIVTGVSVGTAVITYMMPSGCFTTAVVTVNPTPRILGSTAGSTVCAGSTVSLTAIPTGGTWTSGNVTIATVGSSSGIVTTLSPGTVVITYTLPTGCFATTVIVVVSSPGVITGTMAMCVGGSTVLFGTPGGGTWTSGTPGVATINPSTGVMAGISAGTTVVTYALSSGCISTAVVTVNANPAPIVGASSVCAGTTITLTNGTPGGVWSSSNTGVATVGSSTGIVTGVAPGTVTIIYTLPTGCSASKTILVNPSPGPISGPATLCAGSSAVFTGTGGGTWSSSNTGVATVGSVSGVVTAVSVGTATITYMQSNGCYVVRLVTVNPQPGPISGPPYVCVGNSVTLTVSPSGGIWSSSNPLMGSVNALTGVVTGISAGTVTITYTLPGGCFSTFILPVRPAPCIPAEVNNVTAIGNITLFPNPASDELVIKDESGMFSSFTITNSVGQALMQGKLKGKETTVSVKMLPNGMYYFNAAGDGGMNVVKFVKL